MPPSVAFPPPGRLARTLLALLLLAPFAVSQACAPSSPEEGDAVTTAGDATDDVVADPAAGDLGGDELQAATPSRPDAGLDGEVDTAAPAGAPEEGAEAGVPAGFEDTVQEAAQRAAREPGTSGGAPPAEPVALTSVWVHLLAPAEAGGETGRGGGDVEVLAREAGEVIGCGDVVVAVALPVEAEVTGPGDRVRVALEALFGLDAGGVPGDLMNALQRSSLEVDRVEPVAGRPGVFRAHLVGDLRMGGVCDTPRVRAQIEGTAERAEGVEEVQVFLDGEPLDAVLSARGG